MFIHRQNLTETQTRQRRTVQQNKQLFAHFPPQVFAAAYLRGCFKCPDMEAARIGDDPLRSSVRVPTVAVDGMGSNRDARASREDEFTPPPLPPHVHPIKQFSKKAELAASTCTTMDKTSHLRVYFLVLSKKAPLPVGPARLLSLGRGTSLGKTELPRAVAQCIVGPVVGHRSFVPHLHSFCRPSRPMEFNSILTLLLP